MRRVIAIACFLAGLFPAVALASGGGEGGLISLDWSLFIQAVNSDSEVVRIPESLEVGARILNVQALDCDQGDENYGVGRTHIASSAHRFAIGMPRRPSAFRTRLPGAARIAHTRHYSSCGRLAILSIAMRNLIIAAAFGLYLVAVIITIAVNVPLNDAIKAAGDPARIDVTQVRAQFNEARWAAWNLVRVATSVPAFGLLAWALVLCGRANP